MTYKNLSRSAKTFYGVTFKPGEIRTVPGYINHPKFVCVPDTVDKVDIAKSSKQPVAVKSADKEPAKSGSKDAENKQGGKS